MWKRALLGAVVAHILVIVVVFLLGAIFGFAPFNLFETGSRSKEFGLQGGRNSLGVLPIIYIFSFGIVPLIVAAIGAVFALKFRR